MTRDGLGRPNLTGFPKFCDFLAVDQGNLIWVSPGKGENLSGFWVICLLMDFLL
jgi:hypothetical protein